MLLSGFFWVNFWRAGLGEVCCSKSGALVADLKMRRRGRMMMVGDDV